MRHRTDPGSIRPPTKSIGPDNLASQSSQSGQQLFVSGQLAAHRPCMVQAGRVFVSGKEVGDRWDCVRRGKGGVSRRSVYLPVALKTQKILEGQGCCYPGVPPLPPSILSHRFCHIDTSTLRVLLPHWVVFIRRVSATRIVSSWRPCRVRGVVI